MLGVLGISTPVLILTIEDVTMPSTTCVGGKPNPWPNDGSYIVCAIYHMRFRMSPEMESVMRAYGSSGSPQEAIWNRWMQLIAMTPATFKDDVVTLTPAGWMAPNLNVKVMMQQLQMPTVTPSR